MSRPRIEFEPMPAHPGFRSTDEQYRWLQQAAAAHGFGSLGEWLRQLAVSAGEAKLGTPFPPRKPTSPKAKKIR
jgi:hypothetical protein